MKRTTVAVPEIPVRLRVNDRAVASWSCSPDALDALGAGRALALGFARGPEHILAVRVPGVRDGVQQIEVDVPLKQAHAAGEELDHRARHGCGLRFLLDCRRDLLPTSGPRPPLPGAAAFRDLFRDLFDRSPSRERTGGHHTAALVGDGVLIHVHEEVGRHNGVDKTIGSALLAGSTLTTLGLLTTARISGEIAEKAARAGLAWVASRSVPTTLAVEIAAAAGLPLVARAPGKDVRVFRPGDE